MSMNFEVHKPNLSQMQDYLKDQNKGKSKGGGKSQDSENFVKWWNIPTGLSSLRILPPWDPTGRIALPVYAHRIPFQGEGMKFKRWNWTCQNATFGKTCKICDALTEITAAGVDTNDWGPWGRKFYFNVMVMHDPVYHDQVTEKGKDPKDVFGVAPGTHVLMRAPKNLYDWVVSQITNPMIGDISDITNGIDIYVTKEGEGLGTKYSTTLSPNGRQPVPQEYLEALSKVYNVDEVFSQGYEDEVLDEVVTHLKKSAGVFSSGAVQNTHASMGGYVAPQAPAPQAPAFGGGAVPPVVAPPIIAPPPIVEAPMEHTDEAGNLYHLINNEWKLVRAAPPAIPTPPPAPIAPPVPAPPMAPSIPVVPSAPIAPIAPPIPVAPPVPQAPMVNQTAPAGAPPSAPSDDTSDKPLCFGQHNPADIKCVVCPFESQCAPISPK